MKKGKLKNKFLPGSAFILVVVLTTLLALIGVMFLLTARVDEISTSAIAKNKQLDAAVETIISDISQQLVWDTPGIDPNGEYYDYPDEWNRWLANLEPYTPDGTTYYWRQISDVTEYLTYRGIKDWLKNATQDVPVKPPDRTYIPDYPEIKITGNLLEENWADADGDGIADSKWIELFDMTTNKGEPVYAAIRVIDNSAKINVNTAYKFNPFDTDLVSESGSFWRGRKIDGTSQMQINLAGLARVNDSITEIQNSRCGSVVLDMNQSEDWQQFNNDMVRRIVPPNTDYLPFDISDELELRNRFFLTTPVKTRLENLWSSTIGHENFKQVPYSGGNNGTLGEWWDAITQDSNQPDRRHFLSTYNMDRVIDPWGVEMAYLNVANFNAQDLYQQKLLPAIAKYYAVGSVGYNKLASEFAQVAANIKDYGDIEEDKHENVTTVDDIFGIPHYGDEPPRMYISELAFIYTYDPCDPNAVWVDPKVDPNNAGNLDKLHRSFAIEIFKEFNKDEQFDDWQLYINGPSGEYIIPLNDNLFRERGGRYYVIVFEDANAALDKFVRWIDTPADGAEGIDPTIELTWCQGWFQKNGIWYQASSYDVYFAEDCTDCNYPCENVIKADHNSIEEFIGNQMGNLFDPFGQLPLDLDTKYCWRIDDVNDKYELTDKGDTLTFTTWDERPSSIYTLIGPRTVIFAPGSTIALQRFVPGAPGDGFITVDLVGFGGADDDVDIPLWLVDVNDVNYSEASVRSFQRDIYHSRIKRLWNVAEPLHPSVYNATLGHSNNFSWPDETLPRIQRSRHLHNVGEIGDIFKKSTYYQTPTWQDRIQITYTEEDIKVSLLEPAAQDILNFVTVLVPPAAAETRVKGRININTAPWYVIAQLPWVSAHTPNYELARAIVAYRDKKDVRRADDTIVVDYSLSRAVGMWGDISGKYPVPLWLNVYEWPGFSNKGQLANVTHSLVREYEAAVTEADAPYAPLYDIKIYGRDKDPNGQPLDQRGYPDLTFDARKKVDDVANDFEERDLIFARISDLVTVRSDVFTAYMLVRLGQNGPQKRAIAILDRSRVFSPAGKVKVRALYEVPDAR